MKKIEINLQLSLDDELDEAIYGGFYSHTRNDEGNVLVKTSENAPWIPVNDWKQHRYVATEYTLKRISAHFIRIGKHLKETQKEALTPGLREGDDERIRKALICGLSEGLSEHNWQGFGGAKIDECIAYLEKRKEQKPAEWNDTDMKEARDNLISVCKDWERGEQTTLLPVAAVRARYFLEHLTEPKPAERN